MWRDVFLYNRDAVLEMLGRFNEDLTALQRMIRRGDGQGLYELFTRTRAIRRGIVEIGQETAAPDFGRRAHDFWVFAYGSLIWNPGFAYKSREPAKLLGYHRRYCILSKTYRGTPEKPGLVLGLEKGGACEGIVYRVPGPLKAITMEYLRERELVTAVYHETIVAVETRDGDAHHACTYVADTAHDQYVRIDELAAIVDQIEQSAGEAGPNYEYAMNTWSNLSAYGISDPAVEAVATELMRRAGRG
jgi:cation transport protein ChaC